MFMFDVETLDTESTTVILSAALCYFDVTKKPSFEQLVENSVFVKFDVDEQREMGRTMSKDTMKWWKDQTYLAKQKSFVPSDDDVTARLGIEIFHRYIEKYDPDHQCQFWARGSLDQMSIDSLARQLGMDVIAPYWAWRDVRTAVDCLCGSNNGYTDVDFPGFMRDNVIKHDPVHDCALDAMMLMYGKEQ